MMNKNIVERDRLLFGEYNEDKYIGGSRRFNNINVEVLKKLIDEKFIDIDGTQNNSPSTEEFYKFMKAYPSFTAYGYAITDKRSDYRITIEGIESPKIEGEDKNLLYDFIDFARYADEFECRDSYSCWWD